MKKRFFLLIYIQHFFHFLASLGDAVFLLLTNIPSKEGKLSCSCYPSDTLMLLCVRGILGEVTPLMAQFQGWCLCLLLVSQCSWVVLARGFV